MKFEAKIKQILEATSVDLKYALKEIENFNMGKAPYNREFDEDIETLSLNIIKNLGLNPKKEDQIIDHLIVSLDDDDKLPEDKNLIKELYKL